MTTREVLEAACRALQQGAPAQAREILDSALMQPFFLADPRPETVRIVLDVTPAVHPQVEELVDGERVTRVPAHWVVDVVARRVEDGVALARGRGRGLAEATASLGKALDSDQEVVEAIYRARGMVWDRDGDDGAYPLDLRPLRDPEPEPEPRPASATLYLPADLDIDAMDLTPVARGIAHYIQVSGVMIADTRTLDRSLGIEGLFDNDEATAEQLRGLMRRLVTRP